MALARLSQRQSMASLLLALAYIRTATHGICQAFYRFVRQPVPGTTPHGCHVHKSASPGYQGQIRRELSLGNSPAIGDTSRVRLLPLPPSNRNVVPPRSPPRVASWGGILCSATAGCTDQDAMIISTIRPIQYLPQLFLFTISTPLPGSEPLEQTALTNPARNQARERSLL